ncbi:MAG: nucleotide exchange factor GrpE [Salibacteraceae bacterium]
MSEEKVTEEKELENENIEAQSNENPTGENTSEDSNEEQSDAKEKHIPTAEELIEEANNKYMRLYSEFENFRRRTAKEKLELISTASEGLIKDLLPVLDDFGRAIKTNEDSEDLEALKEGVNIVYQKFNHTLKSKGVEEMDSQGKDFNIDEHEALTKIPAPDDSMKGKVVDVIEKGYKLKDKVIRYAKVVVGE